MEIVAEQLKALRNKAAQGYPPGWELMRDTMDKAIKIVEETIGRFSNTPVNANLCEVCIKKYCPIKEDDLGKGRKFVITECDLWIF